MNWPSLAGVDSLESRRPQTSPDALVRFDWPAGEERRRRRRETVLLSETRDVSDAALTAQPLSFDRVVTLMTFGI